MSASDVVFEVDDLHVTVPGRPPASIVRGVSWTVRDGQTLAVVGESGSGKSVTALSCTGLGPPAADVSGAVRLRGEELLGMRPADLASTRGRRIGFVFQDPMTSLNPLLPVGRQVSEAGELHLRWSRQEGRDRAVELLDMVGIPDAKRRVDSYPHQFSGGMRQRVMIAMALSCEPELIIADEPTTALDVTTQAQIVELVAELQQRLGTAVVWITHDLGVVAGIADQVVVMYGGQVVEESDVDTLFARPAHPYTRGLLTAIPRVGAAEEELVSIPGSPPSPFRLPSGCTFHPRCPVRGDARCAAEVPPLTEVEPGHRVRTWYSPQVGA